MTDETSARVGVGPWQGELPEGEQWDPELLANGDARNVIDKYRYWTVEAIRADLDHARHSFHVAIENFQHDSNIGSVVRSANAFGAKEVHVVGRKRWNRRGAMVTDRYQHIRHHESVEAFLDWARAEGLAVVGIDITETSIPMETYAFPRECVLVFGQESVGLSEEMMVGADDVVHITQYGSTRSINVGAAASVAMWAWLQSGVTS
ncbi:SpoU rRNA Methylase family protein [Ruaniaceae bacterium KH17]|nr:SpoU rRNA Methylase family protein [Ruaniaceae bacterium KH17]